MIEHRIVMNQTEINTFKIIFCITFHIILINSFIMMFTERTIAYKFIEMNQCQIQAAVYVSIQACYFFGYQTFLQTLVYSRYLQTILILSGNSYIAAKTQLHKNLCIYLAIKTCICIHCPLNANREEFFNINIFKTLIHSN